MSPGYGGGGMGGMGGWDGGQAPPGALLQALGGGMGQGPGMPGMAGAPGMPGQPGGDQPGDLGPLLMMIEQLKSQGLGPEEILRMLGQGGAPQSPPSPLVSGPGGGGGYGGY